ncbi:hypothetical protein [Aurantivibrio plasticivorans]
MDNIAASVEAHKNKIQTGSGTVASIGLEMTGKTVAGALITPATWALNYASDGSKPGAVDALIYGSGFLSTPAAIATGVLKAAVDDDLNAKLSEVKRTDNQKFRSFFKACSHFAGNSPQINAMNIASKGGTAWKHPNGLWVYITDAKGQLVSDFQPRLFTEMYQPDQPLKVGANGGFKWSVKRS